MALDDGPGLKAVVQYLMILGVFLGKWISIKFLLSALLFFSGVFAQAEITVNSVTGASNYVEDEGNRRIFGGIAGSCTAVGTSTCDSCNTAAGSTDPCNLNRVDEATALTITLTSSTNSGHICILDSAGNELVDCDNQSTGSTSSVSITWQTLCTAENVFDSSTDCEGTLARTTAKITAGIRTDDDSAIDPVEFDVYLVDGKASGGGDRIAITDVSANALGACNSTDGVDGICDIQVIRGDKKVFIDANIAIDANGVSKFQNGVDDYEHGALRIFYTDTTSTSLDDIGNKGTLFTDFPLSISSIDSTLTLDDTRITGLANGTTYTFRFASVDSAGNIGYFLADSVYTTACGGTNPSLFDSDTDNTNVACTYVQTPEEVAGILEKDLDCFIATAAYGSILHPKLYTFRKFRDRFLLTNALGAYFTKVYYKYGKGWARSIQSTPWMLQTTRVLLWPVWAMAWLSLHIGLMPLFVLALGSLMGLTLLRRRWAQ